MVVFADQAEVVTETMTTDETNQSATQGAPKTTRREEGVAQDLRPLDPVAGPTERDTVTEASTGIGIEMEEIGIGIEMMAGGGGVLMVRSPLHQNFASLGTPC